MPNIIIIYNIYKGFKEYVLVILDFYKKRHFQKLQKSQKKSPKMLNYVQEELYTITFTHKTVRHELNIRNM